VASTEAPVLSTPSAAAQMSRERWGGLRTLIWARLLVAALALPFGILLRSESAIGAWRLVGLTLASVAVLSGLYWAGTVWGVARRAQIALQVVVDLALVTLLSSVTGGTESPFALFYVLVAITGGLQLGLVGGLIVALGASLAYSLLVPGGPGWMSPSMTSLPRPGMFSALLLVLAVLSATLQRRAHQTRESLARAARELDRVRFDHDAILRHLTSGVITLDRAATVAYLNPAAEDVLRVSFAELRGKWVQDTLPARLHPLRDALLAALESHSTQSRGELLLKTENGADLPLGLSTSLLTHEGQVTGVVAVFQDLTQVREMEQRALRNQTLAEVGSLAAVIAHELRNGLSPISGSVEMLQRELKLEGDQKQLMALIFTECARLNRFVTDLLAYSRERAVVRMPLDVNDVLTELCDSVALDPRAAGVAVRYQPGNETIEVPGDREQLRQVWLNLANNALDALEGAGTLVVRWSCPDSGHVVVEFEDSGPGIAARDMVQVGQPFFTTKKGGTGLGLPIAQRIVERHGGTLTLHAARPQGTIARITLPATAGAAARAA
jgi:two-component system, NtrC family, sensor histidine kinase PilS